MAAGRTILKVVGALVALVIVGVIGGLAWAGSATATRLGKTYETHKVDFPVPFPLTEAETAELREQKRAALPEGSDPAADPLAGVDLAALAQERAVARGKHLVEARYSCFECHGRDFAGGVMVDDPAVGKLHGPNLTGGRGSRTGAFTVADWDRIVRHGVRPDGTPAVMPSQDFAAMSDRELSDLIAYIRSLPKVDKEVSPLEFGPLLKVLVATGEVRISAELHPDHKAAHVAEPPADTDPIVFGKHLAQTCTGCHNPQFTGGKIPGGPPDWAPAANLTPHADGLAGYTYDQFEKVMRSGVKRDGSQVRMPMSNVVAAGKAMSDKELRSMFAFLQTLPAAGSVK